MVNKIVQSLFPFRNFFLKFPVKVKYPQHNLLIMIGNCHKYYTKIIQGGFSVANTEVIL